MTYNIQQTKSPEISRINERTEDGVTFYETYNDQNHNNRHAEYRGVELFAFPFQNFSGTKIRPKIGDFVTDDIIHINVRLDSYPLRHTFWFTGYVENGKIDKSKGNCGTASTLSEAIKAAIDSVLSSPST